MRAGNIDYVIDDCAIKYMSAQKLPKQTLRKLVKVGEKVFADKVKWNKFLANSNIRDQRLVRIVTEGALLGSVLKHGINPDLAIVSDDAGQFNILLHGLCWIHAERVFAKLIGFTEADRQALEQTRTKIWELYDDLKAYKLNPNTDAKKSLDKRFDKICNTETSFASLNLALKRMKRNKSELLLVLRRPDLPLHNNLSERDIREYVKRRKISGGTRNENGRRCRDTFSSLKKTCRKLSVSFWDYINDRLQGQNLIPRLPDIILARAQAC